MSKNCRKKQNQDDAMVQTFHNIFFSKKAKDIAKGSTNVKLSEFSKIDETDFEKIKTRKSIENELKVENDDDIDETENYCEQKEFQKMRKYQNFLSMPKRPPNCKTMTGNKLKTTENQHFLAWVANIENDNLKNEKKLSKFEHNIHFWRELWRVIEKSDILVQVLDARNPLLFRNRYLEEYVKEVDKNKQNILLINKSDYLTKYQRQMWADYFNKENIRVIFWSAIGDKDNSNSLYKDDVDSVKKDIIEDGSDHQSNTYYNSDAKKSIKKDSNPVEFDLDYEENVNHSALMDSNRDSDKEAEGILLDKSIKLTNRKFKNTNEILSIEELFSVFESIKVPCKSLVPAKITVGLIGYPNVGKSSTLNAIYGSKKVSVSTRPGRTKNLQTLHVTDKFIFCDCPGLVMPLAESLTDIVLAGIYPIDILRNVQDGIDLIGQQFPRETIEAIYGMKLVKPKWNEDQNRYPTGIEISEAFAYSRNMRCAKGVPYIDKAARIILNDYISGKLLYRYPPPNISSEQFHSPCDIPEHKLIKYNKREGKAIKSEPAEDFLMRLIREDKIMKGLNQSQSNEHRSRKEKNTPK